MRTWTTPAAPDRENEDAVAACPGGAVLADGAGLPAELRQGCGHSVAWYARRLVDAVATRSRDGSLVEAARAGIRDVRAAHPGCTLAGGSPSATLAVARVRGDVLDTLCLADSSILLVGAAGTREIVDDRIDRTVRPMAAALLAEWRETGEFTGAAAHLESFRRTGERLRNVPGGFWVAQEDPEAAAEALVASVPLAGIEAVVLASDGAMRGVHLLGIHALDDVARRFVRGDAEEVFAEIRAAEGTRLAELALDRTKPHDDMTVVVLDRDRAAPHDGRPE